MSSTVFNETPRDYMNRRLTTMERERTSFTSHWMELSQFIRPRRGRFFTSDRNKGDKRYNNIINSVATKAHRTAQAGMLAGTMSPARPWFALETHDPDMMENAGVREWLFKVEHILRTVLNDGNFYGQAAQTIGEMLQFGTGALFHVDDFEDVARFYAHTTGSYMVAGNERGVIDTFVREFQWQTAQIIQRFGLENVSRQVRTAFDHGDYDHWFDIVHFVEPNQDFRPSNPLAENKKFRSIYYEPGNQGPDKNKMLNVAGYDEFPVYCPRWATTDEDVYGTDCPGMTALGDIRHLQIEEKRKAQAIDKMVNPPLGGPASLRNVDVNALPGGMNIYDGGPDRQSLSPLYQVDPRLQELRLDINAVEQRINEAFFVDLFLAISQMEGIQPRNQLDLMQRNEERLLQLGPVLEHLHGELLDPVIDRLFNQCVRADILPTPPEALQGRPLRVKYISTLAMAQRAVATQSIDRLFQFAGGLIQLGWQGAAMKLDPEQAVDEYAKLIGTPPSIVRSDDDVAAEKQAIQEAQQMQAMLEMAQQASNIEQTDAQRESVEASTRDANDDGTAE